MTETGAREVWARWREGKKKERKKEKEKSLFVRFNRDATLLKPNPSLRGCEFFIFACAGCRDPLREISKAGIEKCGVKRWDDRVGEE